MAYWLQQVELANGNTYTCAQWATATVPSGAPSVKGDFYANSTRLGLALGGVYPMAKNSNCNIYVVTSDYPGNIILRVNEDSAGGATGLSSNYYFIYGILVDDENETAKLFRVGYYVSNNNFAHVVEVYGNAALLYQWAIGATPLVYSWKPFDTLKGRQYTIPLTMINEDKIGDYTNAIVTTLRTDFDRISEAASLLSIFQNTPVGQTVTIAYSGDNWATMQAQKNPEPDTNDFLLDIKFRMASTQSIIYSYTARIQFVPYLQYPYLSFIVDDDEEVAVFDCVTYYESSASLQEPHWGYIGRSQTKAEMHALWLWLQPSKNAEEPNNPYEDGTDDNGGEGGNPTPQTHLPLPSLPSEGGLDLGLFTVYNFDSSNKSMLSSISAFLWSDDVLDNFKKYFNNFSDNILALYILPYTPASLPTKTFKVGRVTSDTITAAPYLVSRFVDIDMGSVEVKPRWTSYIDYSPYTKFEIYLPGIGIESLDADDIMSPANSDGELVDQQGSVISLKYRLDLCTGFIVAYIFINDEMRYQYSGKVGMNVPISGENYNAMIQAFITGGSLVAGTLVKGGLSAPITASLANGAATAVAGTVNAQKPDVYRSGNMGGDASMMACQNPYLIRHVPNKPKIGEQEIFTGFPSYKTGTLSEFDGYTECIEAHVEGISCTETERDMIIDLLKNGVIL